jgi:protein-tyrosine-phosphatase
MNILFICKYNRFRSKIAEAYFNSKRPKGSIAKSAGLVPGIPITRDIITTSKLYRININGRPRGLNHKLLQWADKIIVMSDKIPGSVFFEEQKNDKKEIIIWRMADALTPKDRPRIIKEIKKRVDKLF